MKKIVFILSLMALLVTGCQNHNVIKVVMENEEDTEVLINDYLDEICDGEVVDCKIRGRRVTLIYDCPIKEIWRGAFECKSLKNIEIPSSVTTIGDYAFVDCESLKNIKIPSSVTKIGESAFSGCVSLKNIEIPSSVTKIGDCAFRGCESLKNIKIPSSVTKIGDYAFVDCESLKKVRISRNTDLGYGVFPEDVEIIEY